MAGGPDQSSRGWDDDTRLGEWNTHNEGEDSTRNTVADEPDQAEPTPELSEYEKSDAYQKRIRIHSRPIPLALLSPQEVSRSCVDKPVIIFQKDARQALWPLIKVQKSHPYDFIVTYSVPNLEKYNSQSVAHTADPLLFEALSPSPTLFYACDTTPAVHCLVRHDFIALVQLKLKCDLEDGWAAGTVMVLDEDRWIPLDTLLTTLPGPSIRVLGRSGFKLQWIWWNTVLKTKRTKFQFNRLPVELQQ